MAGFLSNLKKFFSPSQDSSSNFLTLKVKCEKCGEEIEVKVRKSTDISRIYEGDQEGPSGATYFLRKEVLGKKCNNLIYATIYFGPYFDVVSKEISGGEFLE